MLLLTYQRPESCFKAKISSCLDRDMTIFRGFQSPRRDISIARLRHDLRHPALTGNSGTRIYIIILLLQILHRNCNPEQNKVLKDFKDGSYYQNHPLYRNNQSALQIQLYYDGFELVNFLGTKILKHNLGNFIHSLIHSEVT